jgi:SAM-dependent methyltransferase
MDSDTYSVEAGIEATHWWFTGRRSLFTRELTVAGVPCSAATLDIGTSTGANLRLLRQLGFTRVEGLETSEAAIQFCCQKGLGPVRLGDVCAMPFADARFDLVLATDIIEHVRDDERALCEIARVLRPDGRLLLTVPAFPSLWGLQDRVAHHRRRYRRGPVIRRIRAAGLRPERIYHFNYLLFGPIWLARRVIDLLQINLASEAQVNSPLLNRLLQGIFALDIATAPRLRPPFGVSILVMAVKT